MTDPFQSRVFDLFPTAVIVGRVPDAERLNPPLKEAILRKRSEGGGITRSNQLGWHSTTDMHDWGGDAARELIRRAVLFCNQFSADLQDPEQPRFSWRAEMWANVSPPNASNQIHSHPGALWSCVYYVDDGLDGGEASGKEGGELVLYDPRFPMNRMYAPDLVFKWPDGRTEDTIHVQRPETGMIVGFPSWLDHGVRPYAGKRERISIAINLTVAPVPPKAPGGGSG